MSKRKAPLEKSVAKKSLALEALDLALRLIDAHPDLAGQELQAMRDEDEQEAIA